MPSQIHDGYSAITLAVPGPSGVPAYAVCLLFSDLSYVWALSSCPVCSLLLAVLASRCPPFCSSYLEPEEAVTFLSQNTLFFGLLCLCPADLPDLLLNAFFKPGLSQCSQAVAEHCVLRGIFKEIILLLFPPSCIHPQGFVLEQSE